MPGTSSTVRGEQARGEILEAAKRLFLNKGYGSTSVRDIAHEAGGRSVAGIYNHFPTKQAIFEALIVEDNPSREIISVILSISGKTAQDFVRNALRRILPLMLKHYEFYELAQIDLREFQGRNVEALLRTTILPRAMGVIQQVASLPGFRPMEPIVYLRLMVTIVFGYMITERLAPQTVIGQFSREAWIEHYVGFALSGLTISEK